MSVAERVAAERAERIGDSVGYKIRLEEKKSKNTRLVRDVLRLILECVHDEELLT